MRAKFGYVLIGYYGLHPTRCTALSLTVVMALATLLPYP